MIDISMALRSDMPVWPGSCGVTVDWSLEKAQGDEVNAAVLHMDLHSGTHIDCPYHVVQEGVKSDAVKVSDLCGSVYVLELLGRPLVERTDLEQADLPDKLFGILFKTDNSHNLVYEEGEFVTDYVGLAPEAAQWLVERNIRLVGMDYLSIAPFSDPLPTHEILLENGVTLLEGICLHDVDPGKHELICLPLKLVGAEAVPVRAVLTGIR